MAQTTANFGFNIAEGTDVVNLLTQCYPNFTSLDSILQAIKETGVTVATDTKVGTVHQLVRTDSDCNMFRFIATGNYASGDTFTVDGNAVTATAMDGTSLPAGAFVINQSVVGILNGLVLTIVGVVGASSVAAQDVTYDNTGSGLAATDVQNAIDELASGKADASDTYTKAEVNALIPSSDYSTTERVIGKWVDGTTDVYERTFTNQAMVRSIYGNMITFDIASLMTGIDLIVSIDGIFVFNNGTGMTYGSGRSNGTAGFVHGSSALVTSGVVAVQYVTADTSLLTCAANLTIRYTKL